MAARAVHPESSAPPSFSWWPPSPPPGRAARARRGRGAGLGLLAAVAVLVVLGRSAGAEPGERELAQRKRALEQRLAGEGFTVVIEPPFVVVGDEGAARVRARASGFLRWTVSLLEKDWFERRPDEIIEVWLFRNERTYRRGAKRFFDDEPETPYGYYSPSARALVMNIGPGAGTLSHELVHPYMEANFPGVPAWFNEGVASLYEQPRERDGALVGTTNWRLPNLQKELRAGDTPALASLLSTSSEEFYRADYDAYAMARFLCQYLQDRGKLHEFYRAFVVDESDRTGKAALEAVLGGKLDDIDRRWRRWVLGLRR